MYKEMVQALLKLRLVCRDAALAAWHQPPSQLRHHIRRNLPRSQHLRPQLPQGHAQTPGCLSNHIFAEVCPGDAFCIRAMPNAAIGGVTARQVDTVVVQQPVVPYDMMGFRFML